MATCRRATGCNIYTAPRPTCRTLPLRRTPHDHNAAHLQLRAAPYSLHYHYLPLPHGAACRTAPLPATTHLHPVRACTLPYTAHLHAIPLQCCTHVYLPTCHTHTRAYHPPATHITGCQCLPAYLAYTHHCPHTFFTHTHTVTHTHCGKAQFLHTHPRTPPLQQRTPTCHTRTHMPHARTRAHRTYLDHT